MSPTLGIAIMMNNYFHDVATALLVSSGVAMWAIDRVATGNGSLAAGGGAGVTEQLAAIYRAMSKLALFSVIWIVVGGVPRTIFYKEFEWANAAGNGQVTALVIKHILMFALFGAGIWLWLRLRKKFGVGRGVRT